MIKISFEEFKQFLKVHMNDYDKEYVLKYAYAGEINRLSQEQMNEIVIDFVNTIDAKFVLDHEIYVAVFKGRPFFENGIFFGEINPELSTERKQEIFDFINRIHH